MLSMLSKTMNIQQIQKPWQVSFQQNNQAIFHLVNEKGLIFNDELRFLSSVQPPVKLTPRLKFLLTKDGRQGSTVRDKSKYFEKLLDMKNKDDKSIY